MADFLLWHNLSEKDRRDIAEHFKHLSPEKLSALDLNVGVVLVQWILSLDHIEAIEIKPYGNGVEMFLQNTRDDQSEYLRFYASAPPVNIIYDILETLKGSDYKKARIYSLTGIGQNQRQITDQYPLFFEIVDGDRLTSRLTDIQRRLTQAPAGQTPVPPMSSSGVSRKREASSETSSKSQNKVGKFKTSRPPLLRLLLLMASMLLLVMIAVVAYVFMLPHLTPSPTASATNTTLPTSTSTNTATSTHTLTATASSTLTSTPSQTFTPSITLTNSTTPTITRTSSRTVSPTLTRTPSRTVVPTLTRTPSRTIAASSTRTATLTAKP